MVYTTKLMLKTAEEIYNEVKSAGQKTAEESILNKVKLLVEEDRKRILETAKPITFERLPWKLWLFFIWEILRRPNAFLTKFISCSFLMFYQCVNDEEPSFLTEND